MREINQIKPVIHKSNQLHWEIGLALLIKVLLLLGLWFLIFRWPDRPVTKPDIALRFSLPDMPAPQGKSDFLQLTQEFYHVR
ncbi:MAG: hypothetical protein WC782_12765 [Methylococcaceae bacterium]|jgi:hypothetical protein